jgi:hypothetical protein
LAVAFGGRREEGDEANYQRERQGRGDRIGMPIIWGYKRGGGKQTAAVDSSGVARVKHEEEGRKKPKPKEEEEEGIA